MDLETDVDATTDSCEAVDGVVADTKDKTRSSGCLKPTVQTLFLNSSSSHMTSSSPLLCHVSKTVRWGNIQIHAHTVTIGDNPSVSVGLPVTLTWKAVHHETISVNEFEKIKERQLGDERTTLGLVLSRVQRDDIARSSGFSRAQMKNTLEAIQKAKHSRQRNARDGFLVRNLRKLWCKKPQGFVVRKATGTRIFLDGWSAYSNTMSLLI